MLQTEVYQADKRTLRMRKWHRTRKLMRKNWVLYLFLLPAVLYIGVFHYAPMYGVQLAFKDFSPSLGVWGSPYVGMKYFNMFFKSPRFKMLLVNTIVVSAYNLLLGFPAPVILALLLHYTPNMYLKKFAQTVTYAPHFISTVVLVGMLNIFLSPSSGFVNSIIKALGFHIHGGADGRKSGTARGCDNRRRYKAAAHMAYRYTHDNVHYDNTAYYEPEQYYERGI